MSTICSLVRGFGRALTAHHNMLQMLVTGCCYTNSPPCLKTLQVLGAVTLQLPVLHTKQSMGHDSSHTVTWLFVVLK